MNDHDKVIDIAMTLLKGSSFEKEQIIQAANTAVMAMSFSNPDRELNIHIDRVIKELQVKVNIKGGEIRVITDKSSSHIEWLSAKKADLEWKRWDLYKTYLSDQKRLPESVIESVDASTDKILALVEDPTRNGTWKNRGLIVGNVQSGKTANYIGLVSKAVDAGYKLIIVMAGIHDSLRSQTQSRIDEGILGYSTQQLTGANSQLENMRVGVGLLPGYAHTVNTLTSSGASGDMNKSKAHMRTVLGHEPYILVVKKNKHILENVLTWVNGVRSELEQDTDRPVIRDIPVMIIDDEADNASVDTANDDENPTAINRKIREILNLFDQTAYIGYTATPFANIFIGPDTTNDLQGDDLFPKDFIVYISPASNYIGPQKLFGLTDETGSVIAPQLPIINEVDDQNDFVPVKYDPYAELGELPVSLKKSINWFIIACAVRQLRGQVNVHNSMLIHVTRYTILQDKIKVKVEDYMKYVINRMQYGDGNNDSIYNDFRELWDTDYLPKLEEFRRDEQTYKLIRDIEDEIPSWAEVQDMLLRTAIRIGQNVLALHGKSKDALLYDQHKEAGLYCIAIGGDKLSRGLTLEGLTVSYFLRTSKLYDALLQMGRWFGYRDGYLDVCRLYIPLVLIEWYEFITNSTEELLHDFEEMESNGDTPSTFGLRVRTHDGGMAITAINKMKKAEERKVSFAGDLAQLSQFSLNTEHVRRNFLRTESFIDNISQWKAAEVDKSVVYTEVPGQQVAEYLQSLAMSSLPSKFNGSSLAKYVRSMINKNELTSWTVVLVSLKAHGNPRNIAGNDILLTTRSGKLVSEADTLKINNSNIISPEDEYIYDMREYEGRAYEETLAQWEDGTKTKPKPTRPSGKNIRRYRSNKNGLLLIYPIAGAAVTGSAKNKDKKIVKDFADADYPFIGYALSLPESDNAASVTYRLNSIALEQDNE